MHTIDAVGISRYRAVVDAFASDIRAGRLPAGTRLPTHRQLAAREGIALVTASRVYAELEAVGLVSGEQGRGTFVRDITLPPGQASTSRRRRPAPSTSASTIPLCPARPTCCAAPCANWRHPAILRRCCATSPIAAARRTGPRSPAICGCAGSRSTPIRS